MAKIVQTETISDAFKAYNEENKVISDIADTEEVMRFYTRLVRAEEKEERLASNCSIKYVVPAMKDRLKAAEILLDWIKSKDKSNAGVGGVILIPFRNDEVEEAESEESNEDEVAD